MLILKPNKISSNEITPEAVYLNRRRFMQAFAGAGLAAATLPAAAIMQPGETELPLYPGPEWLRPQLKAAKTTIVAEDKIAPYEACITHNNFYEFGTAKSDPFERAQNFNTDPWKIEVSGEVENPGAYNLEDILAKVELEERVYRLRCVEAWSMVIPWIGFELGKLLKQFNPTSKAKYVEFVTLEDKEQMPGQRGLFSSLDWPYTEGLRMHEAMHPLTLLAVGLYGNAMPPQNGAPIRLVVPWKYGFKSIKSIVAIRLTETMPKATWNQTAPGEYGFYANVNPAVDHPRWSQATERRLPSSLLRPTIIDTQMFNGYAEEVASLYSGMDLTRWY